MDRNGKARNGQSKKKKYDRSSFSYNSHDEPMFGITLNGLSLAKEALKEIGKNGQGGFSCR